MSELGSHGVNSKQRLRDAELYALEEEVFGKQNLKYSLGMSYEHDMHGKQSYKIASRASRGSLSDLNHLKSCLYGVPYSKAPREICSFTKTSKTIEHEGKTFTLVIHSTPNKDNKLAVCSVSAFDENRAFLAYLFTTNDPLNFDNFNTFRGNHDDLQPKYKCVEQLVFCECKIRLGLALAQNVSDPQETLFRFAKTTPHIAEPIIDTLTECIKNFIDEDDKSQLEGIKSRYFPIINGLSAEIKSMAPGDGRARSLKNRKSEVEAEMCAGLAAKLREYMDKVGSVNFYNGYCRYFTDKLETSHLAMPKDAYKFAGRGVLGVNGFLDKWDQIQLMCAVSGRMQQLSMCKQERDLCAALIPRCVIEISDQDDVWAYKYEQKLDGLCSDAAKMFEFITDAINFQDSFITELDLFVRQPDPRLALELLFSSSRKLKEKFDVKSIHTLGLSERLIQSIWTGQIVFSEELKLAIREELAKYGITYFHYTPELELNDFSAFDTVSAIGTVGRSD